jgi:DNA-binding NtrC family response regulator/pSer/pThr/pTyr-binding forkhead associated (FHA) protein
MEDDRTSLAMTMTLATTTGSLSSVRPYLLVITDEHARRDVITRDGSLVLGRDDGADVVVKHKSVSRRHARLDVNGTLIEITDLESHNGTRINGRSLEGTERVVSGDVITLGEATVVLRSGVRRSRQLRLRDITEISSRLEQELDRALLYDRPLSVLALRLGQAVSPATLTPLIATTLRPIDVIGLEKDVLVVLAPESDGPSAEALAHRLVEALTIAAPRIRAGVATCPGDGSDADGLIEAASKAALGGGRVNRVLEASTRVELEGRDAVVADPAMQRIYDLLKRLAGSELTVLVSGETGVGKELAARAVHGWSARKAGPFVPVNCAALTESLVESELFGHQRGAFTGADRDKAGFFEAAQGGTLFLDEIGELSAAVQAKLLRALDNREITRVGATAPIAIDVRVVAATNRDLPTEVSAGRFRKDLYYRLGAATVVIPPLRDRPRDIPALARSLLADVCKAESRAPMTISDGAMRHLLRHEFPGNVRELYNAMRYGAATAEGDVLESWHLPGPMVAGIGNDDAGDTGAEPTSAVRFRNLSDEVADLEKRRMAEALEAADGNQSQAAKLIGMPRRTFTTKMGKYGLRERD